MSPLKYLKENLDVVPNKSFLREYRDLPDEDKEELKQWAREEMEIRGID